MYPPPHMTCSKAYPPPQELGHPSSFFFLPPLLFFLSVLPPPALSGARAQATTLGHSAGVSGGRHMGCRVPYSGFVIFVMLIAGSLRISRQKNPILSFSLSLFLSFSLSLFLSFSLSLSLSLSLSVCLASSSAAAAAKLTDHSFFLLALSLSLSLACVLARHTCGTCRGWSDQRIRESWTASHNQDMHSSVFKKTAQPLIRTRTSTQAISTKRQHDLFSAHEPWRFHSSSRLPPPSTSLAIMRMMKESCSKAET